MPAIPAKKSENCGNAHQVNAGIRCGDRDQDLSLGVSHARLTIAVASLKPTPWVVKCISLHECLLESWKDQRAIQVSVLEAILNLLLCEISVMAVRLQNSHERGFKDLLSVNTFFDGVCTHQPVNNHISGLSNSIDPACQVNDRNITFQ